VQNKNRENVSEEHPHQNEPDAAKQEHPPRAHRRKRGFSPVHPRNASQTLGIRHRSNPSLSRTFQINRLPISSPPDRVTKMNERF
jgi:hypothetical protein